MTHLHRIIRGKMASTYYFHKVDFFYRVFTTGTCFDDQKKLDDSPPKTFNCLFQAQKKKMQ